MEGEGVARAAGEERRPHDSQVGSGRDTRGRGLGPGSTGEDRVGDPGRGAEVASMTVEEQGEGWRVSAEGHPASCGWQEPH